MQTMTRAFKSIFATIILMLSFAPVAAGPLEDADAAYRSGDHATAQQLLQPLADQGDARAQYMLGDIYFSSSLTCVQCVTRDFAEAMKWWRKASEQGDARAQYKLDFGLH